MHTQNLVHALFLALLPALTSATIPPPPPFKYFFANPPTPSSDYKIPTVHESAVLAHRILNVSSIATLSTVFPTHNDFAPSDKQSPLGPSSHYTPEILDVDGAPIGLMDYYAACPPATHNPTILAISIATSFRNSRAGSNVSMSLRWQPPSTAPPSDDPYAYSAANMPRFSLEGYIEAIPKNEVEESGVEECFFARHGDAKAWAPGNPIHESWWGRLVVEGVYWIGGFGDRAYIGWIAKEEWKGVSEKEVEKARLVGEESYNAREDDMKNAGKESEEL